jgi:quercetin dioxygenase-like cupin family protein
VEPPASKVAKVTRSEDGAVLWTGAAGGRGVLVAGTEPPDVMELWDWTLSPGERHASEAHAPGTRELLQVQKGAITVEVNGQAHVLEVGDALTFFGDGDHAYSNPNDVPTRFTLAVYEPGVGHSRNAKTADE